MTKRALCVGINDYPGVSSDLSGCVNDANDWRQLLESYGFEVVQLLDSDARRAEILVEFTKLVKSTQPGDLGVFTYSGHGTQTADFTQDEPDGYDEALCPADLFSETDLITDDEIFNILQHRSPNSLITTIFDSCHSGSAHRFMGDLKGKGKKPRFLPPANIIKCEKKLTALQALREAGKKATKARGDGPIGGVLHFAGCRDFEYSYDAWFNGRANGAFTRTALDELKEIGCSGSYWHWFDRLKKKLPTTQYPQTPRMVAFKACGDSPVFGGRAD